MKRILFILLLISGVVKAQWTPQTAWGYQFKRVKVDSSIIITSDTTRNKVGIAQIGSNLFAYNGSWRIVGGITIDTNRLVKYTDTATMLLPYKNGLNLRLKIADSTLYVTPTRLLDSMGSLVADYNQKISNAINENNVAYIDPLFTTKLNIADSVWRYVTPTQLIPYLQTGTDISVKSVQVTGTNGGGHIHLRHQATDPTSQGQSSTLFAASDGRLKYKNDGLAVDDIAILRDTATTLATQYDISGLATTSSVNSALALKVNYTDTSAMLSPYLRKIDTIQYGSAINARVRYTDTSTMLSAYRSAINTKLNISDTANMRVRLAAGSNITLSGSYPNITVAASAPSDATKLNISDTLAMLDGRLSSITLNTTGAIHNSPVTFSRLGGAWSGTMSLANQSAFTIFRRGSGTGTPSFGSIDSSYFNNQFATQVRAANLNSGTYAQRISLTPTTGQQFYQTNELEGNYIYNGTTWQKTAENLIFSEEFYYSYNSTSFSLPYLSGSVSGTGATFTNGMATLSIYPNYYIGLLSCNTGTTTSGYSRVTPSTIAATTNQWGNLSSSYYEYNVYLPNLSTGSETYIIKAGIETLVNSSSSTNNTQFRYTHSENSGAWQIVYNDASSVSTTASTGVTVAAGTWYRLGIKMNMPSDVGTGNATIEFYVNGTLTNSVSSRALSISGYPTFAGIYKSAGTTSRSLVIDNIKFYKLK